MHSIYGDFMDSAEVLRKIQAKGKASGAKLILRHSLRDKIEKGSMGENVLLTREGKRLAEHFGRHFSFEIGRVHTSVIGRCVQTAEIFARNYMAERGFDKDSIQMINEKDFIESKDSKDALLQIVKTRVLSDSYISDMKAAKWLFAKHSPYYIMQEFLRGGELAGMLPKERAMRILLEYIFRDSMESSRQKLDVFITHDTFLIAIICYIFGIIPLNPAIESSDFSAPLDTQNIDDTGFAYKKDEQIKHFTWPFMLEGAFLYYEDSKIYCIFRGEVGSVEFRF